jgi:hypothetical protein
MTARPLRIIPASPFRIVQRWLAARSGERSGATIRSRRQVTETRQSSTATVPSPRGAMTHSPTPTRSPSESATSRVGRSMTREVVVIVRR